MKRGFTILELLVASLLLGMLVTILTMIFNQSSIAWRTGKASIDDLDAVRENISRVREEADGAFVYGGKAYRVLGLWDKDGNLRHRAYCDASDGTYGFRKLPTGTLELLDESDAGQEGSVDRSMAGYTVNVMSAGPDRKFDTWDDIWSWPDEFE